MTTSAKSPRPEVAVIGAGPAGLMAAEVLAAGGAHVTVFDRMSSPARKLLYAGRGGLNLTHTEEAVAFLARYGDAADQLTPAIRTFDPQALRRWCSELGIETFVGSSGRVFPTALKTSPLLRAWLRRLGDHGVSFAPQHRWRGWTAEGHHLFDTPDGERVVASDATVLAFGGASWPQLGSNGGWVEPVTAGGIAVEPLMPANCGFIVAWSDPFRERFEGQPLKNIRLSVADEDSRGDLIITRTGVEGGPIYPLAAALRSAIARDGVANLQIALRPDLSHEALVARLAKRQPKQSFSTALRKALHLAPAALGLLREAAWPEGPPLAALEPHMLAGRINAVPLRLTGTAPIAGAISTAGGIALAELDDRFMLRRRPGTFAAGEMLDWEAPTGGYLLQACFATGAAAGHGALGWLNALSLGRQTSCVHSAPAL